MMLETKWFVWIFMKFSIGVLYKNVSSKHKFHENQLRESHILRKGINDMLHIFSTFFIQLG